MKFLGIDVGSTFLKSSILDLENEQVMEAESVPTPAFAKTDPAGCPLPPERKEIPMEKLSAAVRGLIDDAAVKYEVSGVVFSVQMHGFMLFAPDGTPLTNYISWQDTRGVLPQPDAFSRQNACGNVTGQGGQGAAGQSAAGQDAAGQSAAGQDAAGQSAAGQNTAGQSEAGQNTVGGQAPCNISVLEELRGEAWKPYFEENGVLLRPNHSVVPLTHYARECRAAACESAGAAACESAGAAACESAGAAACESAGAAACESAGAAACTSACPAGADALAARSIAPGTQFAMIGDALTRMLTGQRAFIHPTNAASSGLFSLPKGEWNRELLAKLGLDFLDMPEVKDSYEPAGVYTAANGRKIPIFAALGDQQATVLGIGAGAGDIFINIGTGGQIGYVADEPVPGPYETRPFFNGNFIRTITQLPSGRTLNVLMNFLKSIGTGVFGNQRFSAEPESEQEFGSGKGVFDEKALEQKIWAYIDTIDFGEITAPYLGMNFSYFDPQGGSISGITDSTFTIDNLIRSAYMEIAAEYAGKCGQLGIPETEESNRSTGKCGKLGIPETDDGNRPAGKSGDAGNKKKGDGGIVCTGGVIRKNKPLFTCLRKAFSRDCRIAACTDDSMEGLLTFARRCAVK